MSKGRYPTFVITTGDIPEFLNESVFIRKISSFTIKADSELMPNLLIFENDQIFFASHTDINSRKKIVPEQLIDEIRNCPESVILKLDWGFVLIVFKQENEVWILNDIWGIYPVYYRTNNPNFTISNDGDYLLRSSADNSFSSIVLYDYFLFNYCITGDTIIENIKQMAGGSIIRYSLSEKIFTCKKEAKLSDALHKINNGRKGIKQMADSLSENIRRNKDDNLPVCLPLSGGFDSRLLLSVLLHQKSDFSAFSYGAKYSTDHLTAGKTSELLGIPFRHIDLDYSDINKTTEEIRSFVKSTPLLPLILDLLAYEKVNNEIPASNIVIGAMGGEVIAGPVIISEVIITRSARSITCSSNAGELRDNLREDVKAVKFLDGIKYLEFEEKYIENFQEFLAVLPDKYKKNLTEFMLTRTYPGFFGVVFRRLFGKNNMIHPFLDKQFLSLLLNSRYRYSKHTRFSKSPFSHLMSRRLYAKLVKLYDKKVLSAPLDRGYSLADILYLHRFVKVIAGYFKNHFIGSNKTEGYLTLNYMKWLESLIVLKLPSSPVLNLRIIDGESVRFLINRIKRGEEVEDFIKRKLILLLGIHYIFEEYQIKTDE
jgi:hypothetical protein